MKTYENNMADQALVVKSLKVLENIDGGGIREIRQTVEAVQKNAIAMVKQQDEYWKDLSADGVISAVEKQGLKREMENIRQSYSAVTQQAASFGYTNPILQDYVRTYETLRSYLYDTLKLFDNMSEDTPIEDREYFNTLFSNYFFLENFILLAITKGVLDTLQFRVLESLNEPGEEGETGLYHGGLYQYTDGRWKSVTTGAYKGARSELPGEEEDAFFLVSETFVMTDTLIVNDTELLVNGDTLGITHSYFKGYIYYCQNGIWNIEEDKTNWRYAAAFADVINVTGELPQIFQDSIDDLQQQIDAQYGILHGDIVEVSEELNGKIARYLGAKNTVPVNPEEGDFFTWNGGNADPWYKGKVYQRRNGAWDMLDPTESANRSYYMMALQDVLATSVTGEGYFSTIFANAFFANDATLQSLSTRTIYLRQGGYIQSDQSQYVPGRLGLNIDYQGNIDANGNTHIGGTCTIDGNTTIGGSCVIGEGTYIRGNISGAAGTFNGDLNITGNAYLGGNTIITGNANFSGDIHSGPLELTSDDPEPATVTYPRGSTLLTGLDIKNIHGTFYNSTFTELITEYIRQDGNYIHRLTLVGAFIDEIRSDSPERFQINDYSITFTYNGSSDSKTFKLVDLPSYKPSSPNIVYKDTNGFLKIS